MKEKELVGEYGLDSGLPNSGSSPLLKRACKQLEDAAYSYSNLNVSVQTRLQSIHGFDDIKPVCLKEDTNSNETITDQLQCVISRLKENNNRLEEIVGKLDELV